MGIRQYLKKDETYSYTASANKKLAGKVVETRSKTFSNLPDATKWLKCTQAIYNNSTWLDGEIHESSTISDLITEYKALYNLGLVHLCKTDKSNLTIIQKSCIGNICLFELNKKHIRDFCIERRKVNSDKKTIKPQTTYCNLGTLKMLLNSCEATFGIEINGSILSDKPLLDGLKRDKLAVKPKARNFRPDEEELEKIYDGLKKEEQKTRTKIPYASMFILSICTGLRISELVELRIEDLNKIEKTILIRNWKGNPFIDDNTTFQEVPLIRGTYDLIEQFINKSGKSEGKIFEFTGGAMTKVFRTIRDDLNIRNFRWHDLRREAISQMIELGLSKPLTMVVSRHQDHKTFDKHYGNPAPSKAHEFVPDDIAEHSKMKFMSQEES